MACGVWVYIGIRPNTRAWEEEHSDVRTVAPTAKLCKERIKELPAKERVGLVPYQKLLILKGQMRDR